MADDADDFFEVKVMAGISYVRRSQIIAINMFDQTKTSLILTGGATVTVQETVKDLMKRLRETSVPANSSSEAEKTLKEQG